MERNPSDEPVYETPSSNEHSAVTDAMLADSGFHYDPRTCLPTREELAFQTDEINKYKFRGMVRGAIVGGAIGAFFGSALGASIEETEMEERTQKMERDCKDRRGDPPIPEK